MRPILCSLLFALCAASTAVAEDEVRSLIEDGHWRQARALLEPRLKANPSDAETSALLSRVRLAYGDLDAAVELADSAVRLDPQVAEYHFVLARAYGEQAKSASLFKAPGLAKRFRQESEAAIKLDPKHIPARLYLISYFAGAPAIAGGDKKKAEKIAREVAGVDVAWGYIAQARIIEEIQPLTDKSAAGEREGLYKKAVEAATTPDARYDASASLVNLYLSPVAQNFALGEQYGRDLVKIAPHRGNAYVALATAYASREKWAELDATLAEGEKAVPENLAPYYQAGRIIFVQSGDYVRAERYFRKFLTQEPEVGPVTLAHGHWRLGLTLEKEGKRAEAVAEMEQAIRLKPNFEDAKKDLRRLRGS